MQVLHELVAVRQERRASMSLEEILREDGASAVIVKSEDLPGVKLDSHESLAENMQICFGIRVFSLRFAQVFSFKSREYGKRLYPCLHLSATKERKTA